MRRHATTILTTGAALLGSLALAGSALAAAQNPDGTYDETVGSNANTWSNYTDAGGSEGPSIPSGSTVEISCEVSGFAVADGNTAWYQIASSPWNSAYYVSADAFYNDGQTAGSLQGTPYVDPSVPACASSGTAETVGSSADTWSNPQDAGGTQGPTIGLGATVDITCRLNGFQVSDGNTWWYEVSSPPWNGQYYVSADAFYNDGATSGSLSGTPWVDQSVPICPGASTGSTSVPSTTPSTPTSPPSTGANPPATPTTTTAMTTTTTTSSSNPNPGFNRTIAAKWARNNAEDGQPWGSECTWFVTNALVAGGLATSSTWTTAGQWSFTDWSGTHWLPGTETAWNVQPFVDYLTSHFSVTETPLPMTRNSVPQAQIGDLIAYNWDNGNKNTLSHLAIVTGIASGNYPEVSEWGQLSDWDGVLRKFGDDPHADYVQRGWTWSANKNEWLQKEEPGVHAWLIHINGGHY